jgi:dienelactone hydrolase
MKRGILRSRSLGPTVLHAVLVAGALGGVMHSQDIAVNEIRIPTHESGSKGLSGVMVRPNDTAAHPLALLTHGTPRESKERAGMTPLRFIPQARELARRGWTAVIVMRRGFGDSGGSYAEDGRACSRFPDFVGPTREAVRDLRESIAYLDTRPEIDPSRMIAMGVSTGGLAIVGLAADPPPNLMAAINFAGGRGSRAPDEVCNPDVLIQAFATFGKSSRVPMLWIYSENDHFFGPLLAQRFYRAFTQSGGKATFIAAPSFGDDGHHLFSLQGIPVWTPMVDDFLKGQNAVLRETLLQIPLPALELPTDLPENDRAEFQRYLLSAPHKAFAASREGGLGVSVGRRTAEEAEKSALKECTKRRPKGGACTLVLSDEQLKN